MEVKPIETIYNGYRFRSRLEARWAVFFDRMGIRYEYEPEGFILSHGIQYLPDFYLIDMDAYVEIKSVGALDIKITDDGVEFNDGREEGRKYCVAVAEIATEHTFIILEGDPVDALAWKHYGEGMSHVFFMGECIGKYFSKDNPDFKAEGCLTSCRDCKHSIQGCHYPLTGFTNKSIIISDAIDAVHFTPVNEKGFDLLLLQENSAPIFTNDNKEADEWFKICIGAAFFARQARFEHGEKPAV